jgi:hypothetical protein
MVIGKQSKSFKRKSVADTKFPLVGIKNLSFAHEANVGDTGFNFASLNQPSEWLSSGRQNPTAVDIINANLYTFRNNVKLSSTARGFILPTEYSVTNIGINFKTFTSLANEIFVVDVSDVAVTSTLVVDSRHIGVNLFLEEGQTDVLVGETWECGKEPPAVLVFRNGRLMIRNSDNNPLETDGNYSEIPIPGTNLSSGIRFNVPGDVGGEAIYVMTAVGYAEKPNLSILQSVEAIAGQVDKMIPVLASVASVPESTFQSAPNNIDLLQFGEVVKTSGKLGDFVYSPALTLSQFQALRDSTWVEANGASIVGSNLSTLTGYTVLPNMVGWYVKINY